jgi:hypothetical protein
MLGELMNIPTDTLIDMLYIILAGDFAITVNDVAEIEQIQRELQRRGKEQNWNFQTIKALRITINVPVKIWATRRILADRIRVDHDY